MATNGTRTPLSRKIAALETGTSKHLAGRALELLPGLILTATEIRARLAANDRRYAAVAAAREALDLAVADYSVALPGVKFFVSCYIAALRDLLGADNPKLRDFGIEPRDAKREAAKLRRWARGAHTRRERRARRAYVARTLGEAHDALSPEMGERRGGPTAKPGR